MLQEEIVRELRDRFRRGATASKLIRIIVELHRGDILNPCVIGDYLEAAFHIPFVRCLKSGEDYSADHTLRHAVLNRILLPELVAHFQSGNGFAESQASCQGSWLDGLNSLSPEEAKAAEQAKPDHGISAEGWNALSSADQEAITTMIANSHVVSCRTNILAKLAESLQQQVDELEGQLAELCRLSETVTEPRSQRGLI